MIALYSALIFLYIAFEDEVQDTNYRLIFYITELSILTIFCIEMSLHLISFGKLYTGDPWNVFDIVIILTCVAFVFLDIFVSN